MERYQRSNTGRYRIQANINIVPLLDILLVLLVIFIIFPSKIIRGFEVVLPTSETSSNFNVDTSSITVEILDTGLYNCRTNNNYIKNINLNELFSEIRKIKKNHINYDIKCFIAASKTITYEEIIKILDFLGKNDIYSIGIVTSPIDIINI